MFYDSNPEVHHHLYNVDTGELTDIYDVEVDMVAEPDLPEGMRIVDTDVVFKVTSK